MKKFKEVSIKCGNKLGYPCIVILRESPKSMKHMGEFEIKVSHGSTGYSKFYNDLSYAQSMLKEIAEEEKRLHS